LFLILGAVILAVLQLVRFSRIRAIFPQGMTIAGIPVGGLDRQGSAQRLLEAYSVPVEVRYGDNPIQIAPSVVGFELDLESMLAAADMERSQQPFWEDFWNFLWGRTAPPADIPLRASYSEVRLRQYFTEEIAARYDKPPTAPIPAVGTVNFQPGTQGTSLDLDRTVALVEGALRSTSQRVVELPLERTQRFC
jgi:beta-lactamase class A